MAANPVIVELPADTWVKVASAVLVGTIIKLSTLPNVYRQTIRIAADPAPTDDTDAVLLFGGGNESLISSDATIDVYVKAARVAGRVRVDL